MVAKIAECHGGWSRPLPTSVGRTLVYHTKARCSAYRYCILYSWKYWQELNLVVSPLIAITKYWWIKFGGLVKGSYHHTFVCKYMMILIWWLQRLAAKVPNWIAHQIFWLYSSFIINRELVSADIISFPLNRALWEGSGIAAVKLLPCGGELVVVL